LRAVDTDIAAGLLKALGQLEQVADALTPDDAVRQLDEATLQAFWREWPNLSSWAGAVWRRLNDDLAGPATPPSDPELDEVGEGG
jgi:hypothetical protein